MSRVGDPIGDRRDRRRHTPRWLLALPVVLAAAWPALERDHLWPLHHVVLDGWQRLHPRAPDPAFPVRIVDIDAESLARFGQWPWPRTRLAALIDRIGAGGALAIGLDMLLVEPDRLSPAAMADAYPGLAADLRDRLAELPSNDEILGDVIARHPVVVARAGERAAAPASGLARRTPVRVAGEGTLAPAAEHTGLVLNVPAVEAAAAGHGLVNAATDDDGVTRRVGLIATHRAEPLPSLAVEVLRVAVGEPTLQVVTSRRGIDGVVLGDAFFPTDADGAVTLHYSRSAAGRRVSAATVLEPAGDLSFAGQVVLVGVTALGAADVASTPTQGRMDGVEVQAQVIENLLAGAQLDRPAWAAWAEATTVLAGGVALLLALPRLGPPVATALALGMLLALPLGAFAAFVGRSWLLDPGYPVVALAATLGAGLAAWLRESDRRRRALAATLEQERVARARLEGEIAAAREIQMAMLPRTDRIAGLPPGISIDAVVVPAREVGGDLYDAFMLDDRRLVFLAGDVAGKGVSAALFMAVTKALCRSASLRGGADMEAVVAVANAEISRENPSDLFVTLVAGLLDCESGDLDLVVAGHEAPYLLAPGARPRALESAGGPALCVLDDFPYPADRFHLRRGEAVVLFTDGVTDAADASGVLYGRGRLEALLATLPSIEPSAVIAAVRADIERHVGGNEAADDLTLVVVRR